jgi:hypothetical protein
MELEKCFNESWDESIGNLNQLLCGHIILFLRQVLLVTQDNPPRNLKYLLVDLRYASSGT